MKTLLTILLCLPGLSGLSQIWVKTRDMKDNNSITEYRRIDTSTYHNSVTTHYTDTLFIHDTICPCCPKPTITTPAPPSPYWGSSYTPVSEKEITVDSSWLVNGSDNTSLITDTVNSYTRYVMPPQDSMYWDNIITYHTDKHHKRHRIVKHRLTKILINKANACTPDTVAGTILYNNGNLYGSPNGQGNTYVKGYYIGCHVPMCGTDSLLFIPGRYKKTAFYPTEGKITKGFFLGIFVTSDFIIIPNWRVYGLFSTKY